MIGSDVSLVEVCFGRCGESSFKNYITLARAIRDILIISMFAFL